MSLHTCGSKLTVLLFFFFKRPSFLYNRITSYFFNCSGNIFSVSVWFIALVKNCRYTSTHCLKVVTGIDPIVEDFFSLKFMISFLISSLETSWKVKLLETLFGKYPFIFFMFIWLSKFWGYLRQYQLGMSPF